jgi:uncharacterized membrane protein
MWFWYSISAAILGSVVVILNKRMLNKIDATVFTWALFSLSLPFLGYLTFKDGLPTLKSLFFLGAIGSAIAFTLSKTIANNSIKKGTLSKLAPLNSFGVFFTYLLGLTFLSESVSSGGVSGLILIIFGAYILNSEKAKEDLLSPIKILLSDKLSLLFILAIFLSSVETIFIKTSLNSTYPTSVSLVVFTEQFLMSLILTTYLILYKQNWIQELKQNFWRLVLISILYTSVSLLAFNATAVTSVALAQGVKSSQLFFTLLLGILFLNDRPTKHTWLASSLMILGVLLIKVYS